MRCEGPGGFEPSFTYFKWGICPSFPDSTWMDNPDDVPLHYPPPGLCNDQNIPCLSVHGSLLTSRQFKNCITFVTSRVVALFGGHQAYLLTVISAQQHLITAMVAVSLIHHPFVAHYLNFVATTTGRDKILRTLQYFSRFYAWYLFRTNKTPGKIAPFDAIKKQFGLARKLLRVGKNIEHFKAAATAADAKDIDPVIKYCALGRQLGYAGYLTFDSLTYLDVAGIRKSSAMQRLQREAYKFWIFGLLFSTASGAYTLYSLKQEESCIDKKNGEGVVTCKRIEKDRAAAHLQLISDLCDLTIPTSAIGLASFDDGLVGLAGTMSSLIGVYTQWKKTA